MNENKKKISFIDGLRFDSFPHGSLFYNNMSWDINKFQLNILFILTYISNFHMILQQYELTMTAQFWFKPNI